MSWNVHQRTHIVLLALPLLLGSVVAQAGKELQQQEKKTVDVAGQRAIVVTNTRGKTIVVGERGASNITILAVKLVQARSADEAERVMEQVGFDVEVDDEKVAIVSRLPEADKTDRSIWSVVKGGAGSRIDFTIEVPHSFDVETFTTSGDVHVKNIAGVARINATSGDVFVRDIGGASVIDLTSGGIEASEIGGDLWIAASSGDAEVRRVKGLLKVETTSGNVHAYEVGRIYRLLLTPAHMAVPIVIATVLFTGA